MTEACRTCLTEGSEVYYINIWSKLNGQKPLLDCIVELSSVQILNEDPLPQFICNHCYTQLHDFCNFRDLIVTSDKTLKDKFTNDRKYLLEDTISENVEVKSEGSIWSENEDCKSAINEDSITSDLENNIFSSKYKSDGFNVNNNCQEHCDLVQTKTTNVDNKSTLKHSKVVKKLTQPKRKNLKVQKIHECRECQKVFKKADHLSVHIAYKHTEKQFKCEICHKKFARKYDLAYHSRVHTGERPFTCEMCGKSFASSSYFYLHKKIHTGHKRIKCDLCPSTFNNSDQLQIHIRQKHTGERPFLCEMCSHAFTSSSALFRHKRDVHDQKVKCSICNKLYSTRVLKDHIKRHKEREEGIKRFCCDLCGKRFTCATSRKRHLVIHSGEKAFKCEVCGKSFNQRSTLQTHMRIHSQIMPFHCEICSKTFRYKHHLKTHLEKHHKADSCDSNDMQDYEHLLVKSE